MSTNNKDKLLDTLQSMFEQQLQKTVNIHHGLQHQLYQQLEALITINRLLEVRHPLPPMRGWAASPDFLVLVLGEILARKPNLVIELGGGVSTLIISYAMEKLGIGKLISFDHDINYLEKTRRQVELHGVKDHVQLLHAPLTMINLDDIDYQWYDLTSVDIESPIDILVVDGPPGDVNERSRYPALPIFAEYMNGDAAVFLDDAARQDEQAIIREWAIRFPEYTYELVNCEKGAAIFRRIVVP